MQLTMTANRSIIFPKKKYKSMHSVLELIKNCFGFQLHFVRVLTDFDADI